jgi:hypothetical protein
MLKLSLLDKIDSNLAEFLTKAGSIRVFVSIDRRISTLLFIFISFPTRLKVVGKNYLLRMNKNTTFKRVLFFNFTSTCKLMTRLKFYITYQIIR